MNALLAVRRYSQCPPPRRRRSSAPRWTWSGSRSLVTRGGAPVRGLGAADFEVRDNGRLQAARPDPGGGDAGRRDPRPRHQRERTGRSWTRWKAAGRAFLDGLREGEHAALLAFHHEVQLLEPLTADLGAVRRALDRAVPPGGSTALADAVYCAVRLREPGDRRTAIVVFSDGIDNLSWLPASDVVEAASRSNATVYGVAVRAKGRPEGAVPGRGRPGDRWAAVRGLERARPAGAVPRRARPTSAPGTC